MAKLYVSSFFLFLVQVALGSPLFESLYSGRIVGGEKAPEGRFPYIASLRLDSDDHFCGAGILNEKWLISAAHCVGSKNALSVNVVVGSNQLESGGEHYSVKALIPHKEFDPFTTQNDIALIETSGDGLVFNKKVLPIKLYNGHLEEGKRARIIGWGLLSLDGTLSNDLQFLNVLSFPLEQCKSRHIYPVTASQLCTFTQKGQGACHGDSGSPVTATFKDSEDLLVGLVSWGKPCAVGFPDVHTRVFSFRNWINQNCYNCATVAEKSL